MPRVSVILPTYQRAHLVGRALQSVLAQSYPDLEVIVVDDGSSDGTRDVIARFTDPRVHYIFQENRGLAGARNTGVRAARGVYIAFLDDDDEYLPDKLAQQVPVLDAHPECGVVYSDVYLCDAAGKRLRLVADALGRGSPPTGMVLEALVYGNFLVSNAPLLRRECFSQAGLFDERLRMFEDWDFWLRLACEALFFYQPGAVARYHIHAVMMSRNRERMWGGALAVRRKIQAMPQFATLSRAAQQFSCYQSGLLECLVGDMALGRRVLWQAFTGRPPIRRAGPLWALSYLGRRALRTALGAWADRRDWLRVG